MNTEQTGAPVMTSEAVPPAIVAAVGGVVAEGASALQLTTEEGQTAPADVVSTPAQPITDWLLQKAHELGKLSKQKAVNLAAKLIEREGENDFELGGVFWLLKDQKWYDGFTSFDAFVESKFKFQSRKARYLMEIYEGLVKKQIPWDTVKGLGWSKLKEIVRFLTPENVDEWVAKVSNLSYIELTNMLKADKAKSSSVEATTNIQTWKVKLDSQQLELVVNALAKAKGELGTENDAQALVTVLAGYLSGSAAGAGMGVKAMMAQAGWFPALNSYTEVFPDVPLNLDPNALPDDKKAEFAQIQAQMAAQQANAAEAAGTTAG